MRLTGSIAEKKSRAKRARLRYWPREADTITFQEGLLNVRATGGGGQMRNANAQRENSMGLRSTAQQAWQPHVRHAETGDPFKEARLGRPALRLADHEVAEHLDAGDRLQLFGIDKISIDRDRVGLAEQLHQTVVFLDQIIRQRGNAEPLLAGAYQAENVVDAEI